MFLLCLKMFLARILDVSIATFRTMVMVRGKKLIPTILAFVEIMIWFYTARIALQPSISNVWIPISYASGYALGSLIGSFFSEKLVKGTCSVKVITKKDNKNLIDAIKKAYGEQMKKINPAWGLFWGEKHYPEYINNMEMNIQCGDIIKEPEPDNLEELMAAYMDSYKMTEEDIDQAIAKAEKNSDKEALTKELDAEIEHLQNNAPINQEEPTDDGYIENLNKQLSELKEKNAKLEEEIKKLQIQLQPDEDFTEGMKLGIDERIIFVSAALGVTLSAKDINQTKLAQAIEHFSGDKNESIRSRIVTLNNELLKETNAPGKGLSQGTLEAVKNVKEWLKIIGKTEVAPATKKLIEEIDDMYLNKKE